MKNISLTVAGRVHRIHVADDVTDVDIEVTGNSITTRYTSTYEFVREYRTQRSVAKTDSKFKAFIKEQKRKEKKPKPLPVEHPILDQGGGPSKTMKAFWARMTPAQRKAHIKKMREARAETRAAKEKAARLEKQREGARKRWQQATPEEKKAHAALMHAAQARRRLEKAREEQRQAEAPVTSGTNGSTELVTA